MFWSAFKALKFIQQSTTKESTLNAMENSLVSFLGDSPSSPNQLKCFFDSPSNFLVFIIYSLSTWIPSMGLSGFICLVPPNGLIGIVLVF